ncbi:hypothetical protein [Nocardioides convexus]|uniref:hypothetical protein n=1 Tax=Nocardioides convexus TaxID=2712224 RepID=UPI00241837EE|nr:hypothetical protein [Nocardioides convexus]
MTNPPVGVPTCYRHPDRETWIRCQRCDKPICPDCMRDASVGFQCPSCVNEGRKSVRQPTAAYGGRPSRNPALTSIVLIVVNAAVWLAITLTGGLTSRLGDLLALRARGVCFDGDAAILTSKAACDAGASATWVPGVHDGAYWESGHQHVHPRAAAAPAFNMLALWFLGAQAGAGARAGPLPRGLLRLRPGGLGVGLLAGGRVQRDGRRLGGDLRPDGRAGRAGPQGRCAAAGACCCGSASTWCSPSPCRTSPGRATSAAWSGVRWWPRCWPTHRGSAAARCRRAA